ncbi:hypothetical protein NU09_2293 [Flavobacterium beibuense]|uniref:Uncharacterized protein n=2 Tax=Flavobacterium beibuense TaxID=657326 RepID=A0A444W9E9_9FLAO|nr:hypothetical protein NU09_2293 [Flavobacterium beibuense]
MEKVVSKKSFLKYYGHLSYLLIFSLLIFTFIMIIYLEDKSKQLNIHIMPILGFLFLFFSLWLAFKYAQTAYTIKITRQTISFNSKTYFITDIEKLKLSGKHGGTEGAAIYFKDNTVKYIYDDMYSNTAELKKFLLSVTNPNNIEPVKEKIINTNYNIGSVSFKNFFIFSVRGGFLCLLLVMLLIGLIQANPLFNIVSYILFSVLVVALHIPLFYYFEISNNRLIVKNHILFTRKRTYNLDEISKISFEHTYGFPEALQIVTKDYNSKKYFAAGLYDSTWASLKETVEDLNINVED